MISIPASGAVTINLASIKSKRSGKLKDKQVSSSSRVMFTLDEDHEEQASQSEEESKIISDERLSDIGIGANE